MTLYADTPTTPRELSDALEAARADDVVALSAVEAAKVAYDEALLFSTPDQLRHLADAKTASQIGADVSRAKLADLNRRLAAATDPDLVAGQRKRRADALKKSKAAEKLLREVYPPATSQLRDVLRSLAEAQSAVDASNRDATDEPRLADVESFRSSTREWSSVLSEDRVSLWAGASDRSPLADDLQARVVPVAEPGSAEERRAQRLQGSDYVARGSLATEHGWLDCEKKTFVRKAVLPDFTGWHVAGLASTLRLPALWAGAEEFWEPNRGSPQDVVAKLDAPLRPQPAPPKREPMFQYSLAPKP